MAKRTTGASTRAAAPQSPAEPKVSTAQHIAELDAQPPVDEAAVRSRQPTPPSPKTDERTQEGPSRREVVASRRGASSDEFDVLETLGTPKEGFEVVVVPGWDRMHEQAPIGSVFSLWGSRFCKDRNGDAYGLMPSAGVDGFVGARKVVRLEDHSPAPPADREEVERYHADKSFLRA